MVMGNGQGVEKWTGFIQTLVKRQLYLARTCHNLKLVVVAFVVPIVVYPTRVVQIQKMYRLCKDVEGTIQIRPRVEEENKAKHGAKSQDKHNEKAMQCRDKSQDISDAPMEGNTVPKQEPR